MPRPPGTQQPLLIHQLTHPHAGEVTEIESGEEEDAQQEVSRAETFAQHCVSGSMARSLPPVRKCRLPTST